jgi:hypothetical protein
VTWLTQEDCFLADALDQESEAKKKAMVRITDFGLSFLGVIDATLPPGREASLAKTKIEEAVHWAVSGLTK